MIPSIRWNLFSGNRIRSLGELAAQFDGELQLRLHELSQHLYAQARSDWAGASLWQSFSDRQITQTPVRPHWVSSEVGTLTHMCGHSNPE